MLSPLWLVGGGYTTDDFVESLVFLALSRFLLLYRRGGWKNLRDVVSKCNSHRRINGRHTGSSHPLHVLRVTLVRFASGGRYWGSRICLLQNMDVTYVFCAILDHCFSNLKFIIHLCTLHLDRKRKRVPLFSYCFRFCTIHSTASARRAVSVNK